MEKRLREKVVVWIVMLTLAAGMLIWQALPKGMELAVLPVRFLLADGHVVLMWCISTIVAATGIGIWTLVELWVEKTSQLENALGGD